MSYYAAYNDEPQCLPATGSELCGTCPTQSGPCRTPSPRSAYGYVARKRSVQQPVDITGNSSPPSPSRNAYQPLNVSSDLDTGNLLNLTPPPPMSGKTKLLFQEQDSSSEASPCKEMLPPIGTPSEKMLSTEILNLSHQMCSFGNFLLTLVIIAASKQLLLTTCKALQLSGLFTYTGEEAELVKVSAPGKRQVYRLTLKIHEQNGGAVIKVKQMLLLMSFEELWTYPMSSGGLTVIQCVLSSKDVLDLSYVRLYGLPQTWLLTNGIQILMRPH